MRKKLVVIVGSVLTVLALCAAPAAATSGHASSKVTRTKFVALRPVLSNHKINPSWEADYPQNPIYCEYGSALGTYSWYCNLDDEHMIEPCIYVSGGQMGCLAYEPWQRKIQVFPTGRPLEGFINGGITKNPPVLTVTLSNGSHCRMIASGTEYVHKRRLDWYCGHNVYILHGFHKGKLWHADTVHYVDSTGRYASSGRKALKYVYRLYGVKPAAGH